MMYFQEKNVLDIIAKDYKGLTKSEKKIADYIIAHSLDVQYMSITSLADVCKVADATISRFCRALGFASYNELKLSLAKIDSGNAAPEGVENHYENPLSDSSLREMGQKLLKTDTEAIQNTLNSLNMDSLRRAAQYITDARSVYCFGQGGSMIIAMEAWARFVTATSNFHYVEDSHLQAITASLTNPGDVILFVSYSGATKDMIDVMRPAKARGAKIILITHFDKSPGAAYADVILLCGQKENPLATGSVSVKMSLLFIIDM